MNLLERREQRRKIRRKIAWTMATVGVVFLTGSAILNAYSRTHVMKYSSNEFDVVDKIELDTGWFDHHVIYEIRVKDTGAHYYLTDKGELVPVYGFNGDIKTSESLDEKKDK